MTGQKEVFFAGIFRIKSERKVGNGPGSFALVLLKALNFNFRMQPLQAVVANFLFQKRARKQVFHVITKLVVFVNLAVPEGINRFQGLGVLILQSQIQSRDFALI